jgi:hypothetical protein
LTDVRRRDERPQAASPELRADAPVTGAAHPSRRRSSLRCAAAAALSLPLGAIALTTIACAEPTPTGSDCNTILAKSSHEWAETCATRIGDSTDAIELALARYGDCYDAATDALAKAVARGGDEQRRGAPDCLPALQRALEGFTEYALGAALTGGTYSRVATAYATLYEKQFRRLAWEAARPAPVAAGADASAATPAAARATSDGARLAAARSRLTALLDAATPRLRADLAERFGALVEAAKRCDISLAPVYEFAVSLLQSPADPPFAPPPF